MRFSIWPLNSQPWDDIAEVAAHAERTGWDRVYVCDHFMDQPESADSAELGPYHEALALMAALAASTERIGLASLVLSVTYRHPAVLANWATTVDEISRRRLVLGLGAGWQLNEHEQYGIELGPPGERLDRFDEAVTVIRSLLGERETTFAGEHYRLERAIMEPKAPALPLLLAGKGDRMLGIVARHADEWNMWALPDVLAERRAVLDRHCAEIGRDPSTIATSTQALWFIDDDERRAADAVAGAGPRPAVGGPPARIAELVGEWQAVGVDEVIVTDATFGTGAQRLDLMDLVIEQIALAYRA